MAEQPCFCGCGCTARAEQADHLVAVRIVPPHDLPDQYVVLSHVQARLFAEELLRLAEQVREAERAEG